MRGGFMLRALARAPCWLHVAWSRFALLAVLSAELRSFLRKMRTALFSPERAVLARPRRAHVFPHKVPHVGWVRLNSF